LPFSSFKRAEALAKSERIKVTSMPTSRRKSLAGCHVLFTGTFEHDREELNDLVVKEKGSV